MTAKKPCASIHWLFENLHIDVTVGGNASRWKEKCDIRQLH